MVLVILKTDPPFAFVLTYAYPQKPTKLPSPSSLLSLLLLFSPLCHGSELSTTRLQAISWPPWGRVRSDSLCLNYADQHKRVKPGGTTSINKYKADWCPMKRNQTSLVYSCYNPYRFTASPHTFKLIETNSKIEIGILGGIDFWVKRVCGFACWIGFWALVSILGLLCNQLTFHCKGFLKLIVPRILLL